MDIPQTIIEQLHRYLISDDEELPYAVSLFDDQQTRAAQINDWYFVFPRPNSTSTNPATLPRLLRETSNHSGAFVPAIEDPATEDLPPSEIHRPTSAGQPTPPRFERFTLFDGMPAIGLRRSEWTPLPSLLLEWGPPPSIVQTDWQNQLVAMQAHHVPTNRILVAKDGTLAMIPPLELDRPLDPWTVAESNRTWLDSRWPWPQEASPQLSINTRVSRDPSTVLPLGPLLATKNRPRSKSQKMHRTHLRWLVTGLGATATAGACIWWLIATSPSETKSLTSDPQWTLAPQNTPSSEQGSPLASADISPLQQRPSRDGADDPASLSTMDNSMSTILDGSTSPSTNASSSEPPELSVFTAPWVSQLGGEIKLADVLGDKNEPTALNAPLLDNEKTTQWLTTEGGATLEGNTLDPLDVTKTHPTDAIPAAQPDGPDAIVQENIPEERESVETGISRTTTLDAARFQKSIVLGHKLFPRDARCAVLLEIKDIEKKSLVVEPTGKLEIASHGKVTWIVAIEDEEPELIIEFYSKPNRRWEVMIQVGYREERSAPARLLAPNDAQRTVNQLVAMKQMVQQMLEQTQIAKDAGVRRVGTVDLYEQKRLLIARDKEIDRTLARWKIIEKLSYFVFDHATIEYQMKTVRPE